MEEGAGKSLDGQEGTAALRLSHADQNKRASDGLQAAHSERKRAEINVNGRGSTAVTLLVG